MVKKKESFSFEEMDELEGNTFRKDENPYLVFSCTKCGQYSYVKLTQKGKKCLRCGRNYEVKKIKNSGDIVNGMSVAVETVKKRQNELAIERLGGDPDLLSSRSYKKTREPSFKSQKTNEEKLDKYEEFKSLLIKKTKRFPEFPRYIIDLIAEEMDLSLLEKEIYMRNLLKSNTLISLDNGTYRIHPL